jgi:carboxypeptidase Q
MRPAHRAAVLTFVALTGILFAVAAPRASGRSPAGAQSSVDWDMVASIREEGLQRSHVMDTAEYIIDVLGARLTLSEHMKRAQAWAKGEMERIGLVNTVIEPFMDYGATWDNEYVSLHMLEPDYQPMVGYPLAWTPGTHGKVTAKAMIVDLQVKADLEKYRGRLRGVAVLATPPAAIDLAALAQGVPRRSNEDLDKIAHAVIAPPARVAPRVPPNADALKAEEKMAFFAAEGVAAVLQCESGWLGAVRGYGRPGTRDDKWSRQADLAAPPMIAVTPEHYNRMYRILKRDIPVTIEAEVRNRIGNAVEKANNVVGDIPGGDLKDEIVMIGAHFDTWQASPNASDDTSGCAVALEAARILQAIGAKPRRTIRIALWGGEEQGLHGSREYVLKHFGDPTKGTKPDYDRFSVYFNQDYGAGQFRGIYLQGNEHARRLFEEWMEPFHDMGMTVISNQSVGSTDHVSFDAAGLPGFQFLQDRIPGTGGHTNMDFYDSLQAEDLMKNAVIMASFAYHAAMSDARVPRKTIRKGVS